MNKAFPLAVLAATVFGLSACGERRDAAAPAGPAADQKVNADATVIEPRSDTPPARADAEDPSTGTNSRRPDSPRDLKPGTDGNSPPVR